METIRVQSERERLLPGSISGGRRTTACACARKEIKRAQGGKKHRPGMARPNQRQSARGERFFSRRPVCSAASYFVLIARSAARATQGNGEENEEAPGEGGGKVVLGKHETRPTRAGGFKDGWAQRSAEGPGRAHLGSGKTEGPRSPFIYRRGGEELLAIASLRFRPGWLGLGGGVCCNPQIDR